MSVSKPHVLVLGSYSGRNAGDAAILFQIADDFAREAPDAVLLVPTTHPSFLRTHFDPARVRPISVMPWTGSVRLLGLPLLRAVRQSSLVLITDGILFDVNLYNPLFSFMPAVAQAAFLCRRWKVPMLGYNIGAGPMTTNTGRRMTQYIVDSCDRLYVREKDTAALLQEIGAPEEKLREAADSVFALEGAGDARGRDILRDLVGQDEQPLVGLNVTSYLGTWLKVGMDRNVIIRELAKACDGILDALPARLVMVTTQIMDIAFAREILGAMKRGEEVRLLTNERLSPREIVAALSHFDLFFGMRLHSLILATAAETPAIGIAYAPKVRSFMALMGGEKWLLELDSFDATSFCALAKEAWNEREDLRRNCVEKRRSLARLATQTATEVVRDYLNVRQ